MLKRGRVIVSRYGLSAGKMDHSLALLVDSLSQYVGTATIPVTASALASYPKAAKKYFQLGLELAIHGLYHLDHTRLGLDQQLDHLQKAREIFQRLNVPVSGFRCPYLRWNIDTLTALKASGFTYDSSQALAFDVVGGLATDAYHRVLEFYGAQSADAYPALPGWSDSLIRIPYCLPDDEALVDRLHITETSVMAEMWLAMLDRVYQDGELFTLGLHPERSSACKAALLAVLAKARSLSPCVWVSRLDEIAAWFRLLGEATFEIQLKDGDLYQMKITAPYRATILARSVEIMAANQPWVEDYQIVFINEFSLRSYKRPLIGLAPGTPALLQSFLRHQGYLFETSAESQAYAVYLDRRSFHPEDERSLLTELELSKSPIVRLSRWPDAARCGLAITGDLDAFTIWDYAKRLLIS